tara:strand:+ start:3087 stop:3572 length:486 start_codon:yes stop_codon:yes gene_type:complete
MTISRASMQKQLKGNRMPNYKTKKGNIKTIKPIPKATQKLLGMKNVKKKASGGKMKKKPVTKAFMGLLTAKPALKFMKKQGIIGGGALGLGPMAAKALKKKKKGSAPAPAAAAKPMDKKNPMGDPGQFAPATPMTMSKGGSMKRKRSIDGIAQRGKTRLGR